MSMIRSTVLVGAAVASAGAMALLGAGAAAADSGINLGPGSNDGVLNGGALNTGVLNFGIGNKGILNLGNGNTGVANIGNGSTGILNIGNGSGGVVTGGEGRKGLLNIGYCGFSGPRGQSPVGCAKPPVAQPTGLRFFAQTGNVTPVSSSETVHSRCCSSVSCDWSLEPTTFGWPVCWNRPSGP